MRRRLCLGALLVVLAMLLLPHADGARVDMTSVLQGPSWKHLLGTDHLGRDVWSRLVAGLGRTVLVVVTSTAISSLLGLVLGLLAGWFDGPARLAALSITDLVMVVPSFMAALVVAAIFGLSPLTAGLTLGVFGVGPFVNQSAATVRTVRNADYIAAEKLLGTPQGTILRVHVLPAVWPVLAAYMGGSAGSVVLAYAGLAFVGLGVDSAVPDWGSMLYDYRIYLVDHPLLVLAPMTAIALLAGVLHGLLDTSGQR